MIERLRRHPFLFAYWLAGCNRLRNTGQKPYGWWFVTGGLFALVSLPLAIRYSFAPTSFPTLNQHALWAAVLAALHASVVVANGRRLAVSNLSQSWLAATPLAAATLPFAATLRTLWPLVWQASFYVLLILGALTAGVIDLALAGRLLLLSLGGAGLGAGIGWYLGRAPASAKLSPLRGGFGPQAARVPPIKASLRALSYWPVAQVMEWANPRALRWPFIWASLTVPIGASAIDGLLWIATWAMLFYMVALLVGVAQVARDAGRWLRVTPLPLWSFALGLLRRTLSHTLVGTGVMSVVLLFGLGGEGTFWTLYVWFALLITIFSIAVIAGRTARDVRLPLVFGVVAVIMVATVAPILAAPAAVSWGVWCWRRGLEV